jgi:CubicO group peptidase (beta-lactamase class C family)
MSVGGLSEARLARMHDVMAGYVDRGEIPGLVSLVSRRGEVHVDAVGTKELGGTDPVRRDTLFRIASLTKPITAAATMILVEECMLRLDEPVDRLVPELADRRVLEDLAGPVENTVPATRPITVRDVLTFRLGYGVVMAPPGKYPIQEAMDEQQLGLGPPVPSKPPPPDEWIRRLGTLPLLHQPGDQWMYDIGSDVLGVIVARASGVSFDTFLRERIFEPLGMSDTGFAVPPPSIERLVTAYSPDAETGALQLYDEANGEWSRPPAFPSGRGGLVSTIDDYATFGQMLLDKGVHADGRLLSRPTVELMTTDHLTTEQKARTNFMPAYWESHGWGFGMSVVTRRDDYLSVGSFGWDGGLGTAWRSDPREEMMTILMTQRLWTSPDPPPVFRDFCTSAYEAIDD